MMPIKLCEGLELELNMKAPSHHEGLLGTPLLMLMLTLTRHFSKLALVGVQTGG